MKAIVVKYVLMLFMPLFLWAQTDSLSLQEVSISGSRFSGFANGQKTEVFDSLQLRISRNHNLAELLSEQSQVFMKSYGPGSLATPSFRGSGAEHTAVLWNGFNLQSPMLGQIDFSLIPLELTEAVSVQYGGNGALFGSGAIGGVVQLNSQPHYQSGLHVGAGFYGGSFSTYKGNVSLAYGSKKWYTTFHVLNQEAQNDFSFNNFFVSGSPEQKMSNAGLRQQALINEHFFQLTQQQQLQLGVWYQQSNRQLPPPMSVSYSEAKQRDESLRTMVAWKMQSGNHGFSVRTALLIDKLVYEDPQSSIYSNNRSLSEVTELEYRWKANTWMETNFGLNNTFHQVDASTYSGKSVNRFAQFASLKLMALKSRFIAVVSLRTEMMQEQWLPLMPSCGIEWNLSKMFRLYGNVSRSYRVPTFNERYWNPGGNPNLKPESGWGEELSAQVHLAYHPLDFLLTMTGFNRHVDNWIVWVPEGNYWSPENLKKVWSRGVETSLKLTIKVNKNTNLRWSSAISVLQSTNESSDIAADSTDGKQLIYVPRVTQQHQFNVNYKRWYCAYLFTYTGLRYTSTDNYNALDDYRVANLKAGYTFQLQKANLCLSAEVNNLWNTSYQVVADRPMPGRNFLIGITIKI